MKKLFSFVCILALISSITVLVGCNGLWNFDDDDDVVPSSNINYSIKAKVVRDSDATSIPSLRAAIIASGYDALVANVYKISDNTRMTPADVLVDDSGNIDPITFQGPVGTYTVRITNPGTNFFMEMFFNQDLNKNTEVASITEITTAIADIAKKAVVTDPNFDYKTLSANDALVLLQADALIAVYGTTAVPTTEVTLPAAPVLVTGVTVTPTTKSLNKGETQQLTATVSPADASIASVTWSTSNAAVATVSPSGLVTAVTGGVANITVTTASMGKTAISVITVVVPVAGVTLDKATNSLPAGSSFTLVATVAPADATVKTVTWTSSDATVATVVDGLVTAVKPGTATITGTSAADSTKSATCVVTVTAVNVTSVSLNKSTTSLVAGQNETLVATVLPANATDKTVAWVSSNTTVATVSAAGVVAALTPGTANVTVTTADGSFSAVCVVTVTAAPVAVTGVTLNKTTTSLAVNAKETLVATVAPGDATNQTVAWSTSDAAIATVNATTGEVTAVAVGTANITVTTADGSKTAVCAVTVTAAPPAGLLTLSATVSGATTTGMQIKITAVDDAFLTTAILKSTAGTDWTFSVEPTVSGLLPQTVVLTRQGSTALETIADFSTITFSTPVPSNARVAVTQSGVEKAFVIVP